MKKNNQHLNHSAPSQRDSYSDTQVTTATPTTQPASRLTLLLGLALVPALALIAATANYSLASAAPDNTKNKINLQQRIIDCTTYAQFEDAKGNTNNSDCPAFAPTIDKVTINDDELIIEGVYDKEHTDKFTVTFNGKTYTLGEDPELTSDGNYWILTIPEAPAPGTYTITATAVTPDGQELPANKDISINDNTPPIIVDPADDEDKDKPSTPGGLIDTGTSIFLAAATAIGLILASIILMVVKKKKSRKDK